MEKSLLEPESDTGISRVEPKPMARAEPEQRDTATRDLRSAMMTLPVQEMRAVLSEYAERRKEFREWLLPQLKVGVHFGYPPGVKPRFDDQGNMLVWNSKKNCNEVITPDQWTSKPTFYKAGAQFVADVMNIVATFDADLDAWRQLGEPVGTFVFRCRLYPKGSPQTPETMLGEGRGSRRNGQKGGDENNAIKMAQKCAFVDAILNGYGLADLFTQDIDDAPPQEQPQPPTGNANAPHSQPRGSRVAKEDCEALWKEWQQQTGGDWHGYVEWASKIAVIDESLIGKVASWTPQAIEHCRAELARMAR